MPIADREMVQTGSSREDLVSSRRGVDESSDAARLLTPAGATAASAASVSTPSSTPTTPGREDEMAQRSLLHGDEEIGYVRNSDKRASVPVSVASSKRRSFFGWPLLQRRSMQKDIPPGLASSSGLNTRNGGEYRPTDTEPNGVGTSTGLAAGTTAGTGTAAASSRINLSEQDARLIADSFRTSLWQGMERDGRGGGVAGAGAGAVGPGHQSSSTGDDTSGTLTPTTLTPTSLVSTTDSGSVRGGGLLGRFSSRRSETT
ncbi:hypothetical protein HK097_010997 [Rhizophlyctis rosea]|uniref:Uncharacterized protein n=1 Tax=Rhizophlyctis rosea TaxID=64517 RepID=A0AAD5X2Q8_9FUNG|nr:hypothetical protein HK097_010997 [Rhizophlyctis rosea]